MLLSAKTNNACLAMIELAKRHANPQPVSLKTIVDEQGISSQFLVQILLQLKRAGLVHSTRGASGGYRLGKHPGEISLLEIVRATAGVQECPPLSAEATPAAKAVHEAWHEIVAQHHERLASIRLADLTSRTWAEVEGMYHI